MYQPTNQPSKRSTLNHPACLLCFRAVTTPQRWMIRPTYAVLFLLLPAQGNPIDMDGLRQGRSFSRLGLLSVLLLFAVCTNRLANQASVQPSTTQPPSMLAVLPCCDNATKVDDTAHLCCSVLLLPAQGNPIDMDGLRQAEASPGWGC